MEFYVCIGCGEPANPRTPGVLTEVTGWTEPRSGGGVHHVIRRKATGRYVHKACLMEEEGEQGSLL